MALHGSHSLLLSPYAVHSPHELNSTQSPVKHPKPAFLIRLNAELLDRLASDNIGDNNIKIDIGSDPALIINNARTSLERTFDDAPHELFSKSSTARASPSSLSFEQNITGKLAVRDLQLGKSGAHDRLRKRTAADRKEKQNPKAIPLDPIHPNSKTPKVPSRRNKKHPPSHLKTDSTADKSLSHMPSYTKSAPPTTTSTPSTSHPPRPQHGMKKLPPLPGSTAVSATNSPLSSSPIPQSAPSLSNTTSYEQPPARRKSPENSSSSTKSSSPSSLNNSTGSPDKEETDASPDSTTMITPSTSHSYSNTSKPLASNGNYDTPQSSPKTEEKSRSRGKLKLPPQYRSELSSLEEKKEEEKKVADSPNGDAQDTLALKSSKASSKSQNLTSIKIPRNNSNQNITSAKKNTNNINNNDIISTKRKEKSSTITQNDDNSKRKKRTKREILWSSSSSSDSEVPLAAKASTTTTVVTNGIKSRKGEVSTATTPGNVVGSTTPNGHALVEDNSLISQILKADRSEYRTFEEQYDRDVAEWERLRTSLSDERERLSRVLNQNGTAKSPPGGVGASAAELDASRRDSLFHDIEKCKAMYVDLCARRGALIAWHKYHPSSSS